MDEESNGDEWALHEFEQELLGDLKAGQAQLIDGGPRVNRGIIESYLDRSLDTETDKHIGRLLSTYKAWAEALVAIESIVPTKIGPPVDEALIILLVRGGLDPQREAEVRRNTRLFRNWYDAANNADE